MNEGGSLQKSTSRKTFTDVHPHFATFKVVTLELRLGYLDRVGTDLTPTSDGNLIHQLFISSSWTLHGLCQVP